MNPINLPQNSTPSSDLEWRAWCYLIGELSEQETQEFETQLQDPAVCQLLADVIALQSSLQESPASSPPARVVRPLPAPAATGSQGHRWSGLLVLLTTTAALWLVFFGSWTSDSDNTITQNRAESQQLTALWLNPDAGLTPEADALEATGDDLLSDPLSDNIADNNTLTNDTEVPGWLIAAITPPDPDTDPIE